MEERVVHILSVDKQKIGQNKPKDFRIKFNPILKLEPDMRHEIGMDIGFHDIFMA